MAWPPATMWPSMALSSSYFVGAGRQIELLAERVDLDRVAVGQHRNASVDVGHGVVRAAALGDGQGGQSRARPSVADHAVVVRTLADVGAEDGELRRRRQVHRKLGRVRGQVPQHPVDLGLEDLRLRLDHVGVVHYQGQADGALGHAREIHRRRLVQADFPLALLIQVALFVAGVVDLEAAYPAEHAAGDLYGRRLERLRELIRGPGGGLRTRFAGGVAGARGLLAVAVSAVAIARGASPTPGTASERLPPASARAGRYVGYP